MMTEAEFDHMAKNPHKWFLLIMLPVVFIKLEGRDK